ncbi:MAG: NERD domain-containing protein [Nanoarchaeota archaeon]|nr:NERD domain-containing protein [Nanoarchaeota archaeon]
MIVLENTKITKHDRHIENLCQKLKSDYDLVLRNVPLYSQKKRRIAEIDVVAFTDNYCDVFEVKCSYRITKARRQLHKIKKILSLTSKVRHTFFYCGNSDKLILV